MNVARRVKLKPSPIQACLLISLVIHTVILHFLFYRLPIFEPAPASSISIRLDSPAKPEKEDISPSRRARRSASSAAPGGASTPAETPPVEESPLRAGGASQAPGVEGAISGAPGISQGEAVGSPGTAGAASDKGSSVSAGSGGAPASGGTQRAGSLPGGDGAGSARPRRPSGGDPKPAIAIPESLKGFIYSRDIYVDADIYILFGPSSRFGFPVPGNEICREGDRLRSMEAIRMSQPVTDMSNCRRVRDGDDELWDCQRNATTEVVYFDDYLSSSINYGVNMCLAYDQSVCLVEYDDGRRETCPTHLRDDYQGIWHASTLFAYRCIKSQVRHYTHPLQYDVRYRRDIEWGTGHRIDHTRQVLLSFKRTIPPCNQ